MRAHALVLLLVVGCGARSGLREGRGDRDGSTAGAGGAASGPAGSGGDGGAPAGGSGAMSGVGGASANGSGSGAGGGSATGCTALASSGPLTAIPSLPPGTSDNTRFHWLDAQRIAVVHRPFDPDKGLKLGSTVVDWVGAWPPQTSVPVELVGLASESFAIDRDPNPLLGLLAPGAGTLGVSFGTVDPSVGGWIPTLSVDPNADRAVFVRSGFGQYFLGSETPGASPGGAYQLRATLTDGKTVAGPFNAGCHRYRIAADALALPTGWLFARTAPSTSTCNPAVPASMDNTVTITRITEMVPMPGAEFELLGSSNQIALVARGVDGGWLVHWSGAATVSALPLDGAGKVAGPPAALHTLTESPFAFAADRLDEGLVLATYDADAAGGPRLRVQVTDGGGKLLSFVELSNPPKPTTPLQVAFEPETRQILVGYSGLVGAVQSVNLGRFRCE